jgi:molybdopterin-containing oxidoreductase family membrane subunit
MDTTHTIPILRPITERRRALQLVSGILAAAVAYWVFACVRFLIQGHTTLGTSSYGATWGLAVANIVHIIGISHVGIAISATVRVLRLDRYRNIARLAEVVTLISLVLAVINIALDVGRPDRFLLNTLLYGRWHAPMVWSATVISLYFVASGVYLYLSMRRDLWVLSTMNLKLSRLFGWSSLGYRDTAAERRRHEHTLFWLAILLVPIMVSVHSVYGMFFGLLSAKAGWFNPLQAPYFVLGAVVSGFSALIVLAAVLRHLYNWQDLIDNRTFRTLGALLAFVVFLYLYFVASEHLTAQYAAPPAERTVSEALIAGRFAVLFWSTVVGGLAVPFIILFVQSIRRGPVKVGWIAAAAAVINLAMLLKRVLLVIPSQQYSRLPLPLPEVGYLPTQVELAVTLGTYAIGGLLLIGVLKLVPVVELPMAPAAGPPGESGIATVMRGAVIAVTVAAGLALIGWGVVTRDLDLAPVKWISGLIVLAAVPLERCLIRVGRGAPERGSGSSPSAGG